MLPKLADTSEAAQENTGMTPQEGAVEIFWLHAGGIKQMFKKMKSCFLKYVTVAAPDEAG